MRKMMSEDKFLFDQLIRYTAQDYYPFHMPGHKRQISGPWGIGAEHPYSLDITEIENFDNLHYPKGILKNSMDWAASVYQSGKTYYLVNGSSCGILSAISALSKPGKSILIGRNCHKSVFHGVILNQMECVYIYPQFVDKYGIQCGLNPTEVDNILSKDRNIQLVIVTSPTYEGIVLDIENICKTVHKYGIPILVDEAHGAHFSFSKQLPCSALELGADIVIQSLHKTLPSFTQTALLHVNKDNKYVDLDKLEWFLQIYQTSSPSYLMMASIENCIRWMNGNGKKYMELFIKNIQSFRKCLGHLEHMELMTRYTLNNIKKPLYIHDIDITRVVILTSEMNGKELQNELRKSYKLEMEMSSLQYVIAITSIVDTKEGLDRLISALIDIDSQMGNLKQTVPDHLDFCKREQTGLQYPSPVIRYPMHQSMQADKKIVELKNSHGQVSAEFIYVYPPGIPILAPGEEITNEILEYIFSIKEKGFELQGLKNKEFLWIEIMDE